MLLTTGADKEAKQQGGCPALIIAAQEGHDKCVELLLNAGCNINALSNDGLSALHCAVKNEHIDCVRTLVRCGADVTLQFKGVSLDDFADSTTIADALKAALCLPAEKRRRCNHCDTTTSKAMYKCVACKTADKAMYYCDIDCQKADWLRHQPLCKSAVK
jgi:hypothetical protein